MEPVFQLSECPRGLIQVTRPGCRLDQFGQGPAAVFEFIRAPGVLSGLARGLQRFVVAALAGAQHSRRQSADGESQSVIAAQRVASGRLQLPSRLFTPATPRGEQHRCVWNSTGSRGAPDGRDLGEEVRCGGETSELDLGYGAPVEYGQALFVIVLR